MRNLASKFASALLIPTALLLADATPAYALQVVEASDGVSVDAVLSLKEPTRIRVDGAPITNVFGNIYSTNCGAAITSAGGNVYLPTEASGDPLEGEPGSAGIGLIRQGALESSNVDPVTELVTLIKTQRVFEMNSQVIQAANETLQNISNIRAF